MGWSFLGAFVGIFAIERIGFWLELSEFDHLFLIGSFGASAVLIYGVPMAEFSQPRNVIGGHVISAIIGISLYQIFGSESIWVCPLAVSLAIFAQQFTRTIHPPSWCYRLDCSYRRRPHSSTWFFLSLISGLCWIYDYGSGRGNYS